VAVHDILQKFYSQNSSDLTITKNHCWPKFWQCTCTAGTASSVLPDVNKQLKLMDYCSNSIYIVDKLLSVLMWCNNIVRSQKLTISNTEIIQLFFSFSSSEPSFLKEFFVGICLLIVTIFGFILYYHI